MIKNIVVNRDKMKYGKAIFLGEYPKENKTIFSLSFDILKAAIAMETKKLTGKV